MGSVMLVFSFDSEDYETPAADDYVDSLFLTYHIAPVVCSPGISRIRSTAGGTPLARSGVRLLRPPEEIAELQRDFEGFLKSVSGLPAAYSP